MLTCAGAVLFAGVLVAAGCGGGGPNHPQVAALTTALQFKAILPAAQKSATPVGAAACKPCHAANCTTQALTAHSKASVDCEACHGPGSVHVAAKGGLTNILRGPASLDVKVCGQCHADVVGDFNVSVHAQIVTSEVPATGGSTTCLRCHADAFHTLEIEAKLAQNPPQTPAAIDTAIVALTTTQINADAVGTMHTISCAGCHDPHQNTANLDSAGEQMYLRAKTSSTDLTSDPAGATPAQYTTINHICGNCHNNRGGDPSDAGLNKNTSRPAVHEGPEYNMLNGNAGAEGITTTNGTVYATGTAAPGTRTSSHVNAPDQCVTCHMPTVNGTVRHTFTASTDVSCTPCHTSADAASRENALQTSVQNSLVALRNRMQTWALAQSWNTAKDPTVWDYSSNLASTSKFPTQTLVPIEIKRARHNYYFIVLDRSYGVHNYAYTQYLIAQSNTGLDALGISREAVPAMTRQQVVSLLASDYAKVKAGHAQQ